MDFDVVWLLCLLSIVTGFSIVCKIPSVRYYMKFIAFGILINLGSVFYTILFVLRGKPSYRNSCDATHLLLLSQWLLGLRPKVYGLENCYKHRQQIYVVNHQSFIDPIALYSLWQLPSSTIVKDSLCCYGMGWPMIYFMRILPIDRHDHAKAMKTMHKAAEMVKCDGVNMFIFPEGTRNTSGQVLPFKKGAFHLAIQTKIPVVPVVISCYNSFLDHKNKVFDNAAYGVYVLPPISTEGLSSEDVGTLLDQTYGAMKVIFDATASATKEELGEDLRAKLQ